MPEIHVSLLGRFAVTVGGVPVAEAGWKRPHAAAVVQVLALYGGGLLPGDRYEERAETRREQLSQSHLDLLRLDGRWETVAELDQVRVLHRRLRHRPGRGGAGGVADPRG
jgi:hypothetical protein